MSADNYLYVTRHPLGGFTFVNGSASNDDPPVALDRHPQFESVTEALAAAHIEECNSYVEYGTSIDPEVVGLLAERPRANETIDFIVVGADGYRSDEEDLTFRTLEEAQDIALRFDHVAAEGAPHYICRRFVEVTYERVDR